MLGRIHNFLEYKKYSILIHFLLKDMVLDLMSIKSAYKMNMKFFNL